MHSHVHGCMAESFSWPVNAYLHNCCSFPSPWGPVQQGDVIGRERVRDSLALGVVQPSVEGRELGGHCGKCRCALAKEDLQHRRKTWKQLLH